MDKEVRKNKDGGKIASGRRGETGIKQARSVIERNMERKENG